MGNPKMVFDDIMEQARRRQQGHTLPREFYCSEDVFELEMEKIFLAHWRFAGHESQIPRRGDFLTYEIGGENIIIVRGNDDRIRSFLNVCRHRGSRMMDAPCGNIKAIV